MLRIHGSARSRATRTLWMAGELGIPYEHNDILPRSPETRTAAFLALNPNGRLPVIEDDGFVLYESMAINFYLAKKHNSPLCPKDAKAEALTYQWSFWETDRTDRQLTDYVNASTGPEEGRNKAVADATWAQLVASFDVLEGTLSKGRWLTGPEFALADLNVAAALYRARGQAFLDAIAATHAPVKLPRATLYLWLPIPPSFANSLDFTADLLDRTGVVVSPGSGFGNAGEGYVRIALCVDEARMREAGRRIVEAGYRW